MSLIRWEPFREIDTLQHEMNRLFDRFVTPSQRVGLGLAHIPAAELEDTPEALVIRVEVPGIEPKDLDVQVSADSVSISGERKSETKTDENGYTRTEFRYGKFQRVIPLPVRVQQTNVAAEQKDGVLTLTLPKAEEEKNRVVKVTVG